jgi:hypothetical protein
MFQPESFMLELMIRSRGNQIMPQYINCTGLIFKQLPDSRLHVQQGSASWITCATASGGRAMVRA